MNPGKEFSTPPACARRYGALADIEEAIKAKISELPKNPMLAPEVGPDAIAAVVSRWTGVPVGRLLQSDRERLLGLRAQLHQRVVGARARTAPRSRCFTCPCCRQQSVGPAPEGCRDLLPPQKHAGCLSGAPLRECPLG